jgi:hypothetical protein
LGIQLEYDIWGISEKLMLPQNFRFGEATLDLEEKVDFWPLFPKPFPKLTGFREWLCLLSFKRNWYIVAYMKTKAAELAGILEGKMIFYVKIETPNDRESIDEITLERQQGITCRAEGNRVIFTAGETTAAFEVLETAQILTNRMEEAEIIVTLAENGGLQVKGRS